MDIEWRISNLLRMAELHLQLGNSLSAVRWMETAEQAMRDNRQ